MIYFKCRSGHLFQIVFFGPLNLQIHFDGDIKIFCWKFFYLWMQLLTRHKAAYSASIKDLTSSWKLAQFDYFFNMLKKTTF